MDPDWENTNEPDYQPFTENRSASPDTEIDYTYDEVDEHLSLPHQPMCEAQQPTEASNTLSGNCQNGHLRLPNSCPDDSFLILEVSDIPEEPVKSKPNGHDLGQGHRPQTSDSDTTDDESPNPAAGRSKVLALSHPNPDSDASSSNGSYSGDIDTGTESECELESFHVITPDEVEGEFNGGQLILRFDKFFVGRHANFCVERMVTTIPVVVTPMIKIKI